METRAHLQLKTMAVYYLRGRGCAAVAEEVRCPISRYRADVAGYRDAPALVDEPRGRLEYSSAHARPKWRRQSRLPGEPNKPAHRAGSARRPWQISFATSLEGFDKPVAHDLPLAGLIVRAEVIDEVTLGGENVPPSATQ